MDGLPSLLWGLAAGAYWLLPDAKVLRWKLVGVEAAALGLLAWGLARAWSGRPGRRAALDLPVLLLGLAAPVFWLLSPERAASEGELARLGLCAAAYFAASRTLDREGSARLAALWAALGAYAGAWALGQRLGLPGFAALTRPIASFGNPIFLGAALAGAVPLALALAFEADGSVRKGWLGVAVLQAAGLLCTQSRGPALALLAALTLWAALRLEGSRRGAALGAAGLAIAAGAALSAGREWTHGLIWRDSLSLWRSHPLLGSGLGRFHLEFPAFASDALKARWPEGKVIVNFAHNEYLQTACETGLAGLGLLLLVPAAALRSLARPLGGDADPMTDACLLAGLTFFLCAVVSPDARYGVSAFAAFAWLGAAAARRAAAAPAAGKPVLAAAWLALVCWTGLAARPVLAVRANAAEKPFAAASPEQTARIDALVQRLQDAPQDADAAEALAYLYAKESAWPLAIARFEQAARLDPRRPGPLNNLGNVHYMLGHRDEAAAYWEKSIAVAPAQIDARLNLAKLLYETGKLKPAAAQLEEVLRLEPGNAKARVLYKRMVE